MSKYKTLTENPGQPAGLDEIDLDAALPAPKRGRGRPRSAQPPAAKPQNPNRKVRKDKGVKKTQPPAVPYIDISNIIGESVRDYINNSASAENPGISLKDKMTAKELRFISLYLSGEHSKEKALILAGYEGVSQSRLYAIASKIVEKYESQAGDHRIIARAMGAGEVLVFKTLLDLMKSKSEKIRLDATVNLAKILGLTKEQVEGAGGITIIFEQPDAQAQPLVIDQAGERAEQVRPLTYQPTQGKMLQITK